MQLISKDSIEDRGSSRNPSHSDQVPSASYAHIARFSDTYIRLVFRLFSSWEGVHMLRISIGRLCKFFGSSEMLSWRLEIGAMFLTLLVGRHMTGSKWASVTWTSWQVNWVEHVVKSQIYELQYAETRATVSTLVKLHDSNCATVK